ncbi:MAG: hypothetical protein RL264_2952 [Bacteroidota bacterium]|jgi:uncharacterized membrane protein YfcA
METNTLLILAIIGVFAGMLSGFVGVGGGVIIVPALVFFLGISQHEAQGTSLFVLSMPVVIFAVMNYWQKGNVNWKFGLVIASTFLIGAYVGSKLSLKMSPAWVKLIFGIFMAYTSFRLITSGYQSLVSDEN